MRDKRRACCSWLPGVTIRDLLRRSHSAGPLGSLDSRYTAYTYKGRCGLGRLCRCWKLREGDEILVPAYNCGTEIDPFVAYGFRVLFYRVDRQANIDLEDLHRRVSRRTRVIYVTHYFGWPQRVAVLADFCRNNHIYLIEDCALSLFSMPVEHPIGLLGDAAIYSLPKSLPVPDGGALTISGDPPCEEPAEEMPRLRSTARAMLPLVKRSVLRISDRVGVYRFLPEWAVRSRGGGDREISLTPIGLPEMPESYYYDKAIENLAASKVTRHILQHTCTETVIRTRRTNYAMLCNALKEAKVFQPLYGELPAGVCPLCFPVVTVDREAICLRLNGMGIGAVQWWAGYHRAFDWAEFPEARYLKENILAIPIHQQLCEREIEYIASALKRNVVQMP
jgi:perosamine synthetase